ncbi:hypothetical protein [Sphingomonas bacterium]|uniref:hypothetical protein n=1 Tax=Sphingomonas bacterium TaxID=1895847 RepID=UPI001576C769|nr:hypothetical protein [Sphingomonas bacterium]
MLAAALLLQVAAVPPSNTRAGDPGYNAAFNGPEACSREEIENGTQVIVNLGDRSCVKIKPSRTYQGLWVNAFEGRRFIDGGHGRWDVSRHHSDVWFSTDDQTRHEETSPCPRQHVCKITFDGREAVDMQRSGAFEGYGHMGMSAGLVLADRIASIKDLGLIERR